MNPPSFVRIQFWLQNKKKFVLFNLYKYTTIIIFNNGCSLEHNADNELKLITENWMNEYNTYRPHDSLQGLTPERFLLKYGKLSTQVSSAEFTTFQQNINIKNDLIKFDTWY